MIEQVCCEGLDDRLCFIDVGGVLTDSKYQNLFFCPHLLSAVWKDCSDVDLAAADVGPDEAFDVEVICHSMDVVGEASLTSRAFKGGELERSLLGHEAHVLGVALARRSAELIDHAAVETRNARPGRRFGQRDFVDGTMGGEVHGRRGLYGNSRGRTCREHSCCQTPSCKTSNCKTGTFQR